MSELKQFTFFESYYKALKKLSPDEIGEIVLAMGAYFFEDQEIPELDGVTGAVLEAIRPNISNSKAKATSGKRGGESKTESKTKANGKQKPSNKEIRIKDKELRIKNEGEETKKESPSEIRKKSATEIVKDRNLDPQLEEKVLEWLKYKAERKEGYKETGLNALITEIQNNADEYGINPVIKCINKSMGSNYKGIIFDGLKKDNITPIGNSVSRASPEKEDGFEWLSRQLKEGGTF